MRKPSSAAILVLLALCARGAGGDMSAERPWMRPTATSTGAVYLTLRNAGAQSVRLTGADCAPANCMIHLSEESGGTMSMRAADTLSVPAHGETIFKPGALHIMVMGLTSPLAEGAVFPIILHFKDSPDLSVSVAVRKGAP